MISDLHCHTKLSDGSLGIEEIITQAKRTGVDFISITDHDTVSSSSRAVVLGDRFGVSVIPGTEFSAYDKARGRKVHILCYMPEKPNRLEGLCIKVCESRKTKGKQMIQNVMKLYPITGESVLKHATGSNSIYKQHIMHALIDYGYADEFFGDVYKNLFDPKEGSCYEEVEYPEVGFVIDMIHSAGGIAVLAHPYQYDSVDLAQELCEKSKLDGIEVWHHTLDDGGEKTLLDIAEKHNLITTGGSDFHGLYSEKLLTIGSYSTPKESIDRIFKKR